MPRYGDSTFHGKKGRSGRPKIAVELAKKEALVKAWNKVSNEVETTPVEKVALPIALRDMGDKQIHSGEVKLNPMSQVEFDKMLENYGTNKKA